MTSTTDMTLQERARKVLADYRQHADIMTGTCTEYYCGQACSFVSEVDERAWDLLAELAGESDDDDHDG